METLPALRRLHHLLTEASKASTLERASFGFPNDRLWLKSVHFECAAGKTGDEVHPDAYIKSMVALHHQTWIIGPLREALDILAALAGPSLDAAEARPHEHEDQQRALNAELRKARALTVLGPLGFVDNGDAEAPLSIFHSGASVCIDLANVTPATVVTALVQEGERRGREAVKAQLRQVLGVAPAQD